MRFNLAYIGAIPHSGIQQVRAHWLLDTVTTYRSKWGEVMFNYTNLDAMVDLMWQNELRPGFEVMGNPGDYFTDLENTTQLEQWRQFVHELIYRYMDIYGLSYVNEWNFETWNEPRKDRFDTLNVTLKGFVNYFDAVEASIRSLGPSLRLGGPGGACKSYSADSYCWALLNHTARGINQFTSKPPKLDYISIHRKGEEPNNTEVILSRERDFYTDLIANLPELKDIPIYNDEADPLVTWSRDRWWRADVTYAAIIVKVITAHQNTWIHNRQKNKSGLNFQLLSNDNGFLSYQPYPFTQRTLLARFQVNSTVPPHVQFIRKPAYTVMGLLSYMGENQIDVTLSGSDDNMGSLASSHIALPYVLQDSDYWSVVVYNSADTHRDTGSTTVKIHLTHLNCSACMYVVYYMDNTVGNPHAVWVKAGRPKTPSIQLFRDMRKYEEPARSVGPRAFSGSDLTINTTIRLPGVLLLHVCEKAKLGPDQVTNVIVRNVTSGQVLVTWQDSCVNTKCIKTYEVQFAQSSGAKKSFKRINKADTIFNSYVYMPGVPDNSVHGSYQVRAVDYWGRAGAFSFPVLYPQ